MGAFWLLLVFNCFLLSWGNKNDSLDIPNAEPNEEKNFKIELFPSEPIPKGQTRMPRTLFKKLHSKAAFLAGLKLGTILSKKGFELGHGKVASTHSFKIFGKSVNSAMSLAYGDSGSLLPLVDDVPEPGKNLKKTALGEEDKSVYHVTVIENPPEEISVVEEKADEVGEENLDERKAENLVLLYQDTVESIPNEVTTVSFLEEHNKMVKEFNDVVSRRKNSKFK